MQAMFRKGASVAMAAILAGGGMAAGTLAAPTAAYAYAVDEAKEGGRVELTSSTFEDGNEVGGDPKVSDGAKGIAVSEADGKLVVVSEDGVYGLSGETGDGAIKVNDGVKATLVLDGLKVASKRQSPLTIGKGADVTIVLTDKGSTLSVATPTKTGDAPYDGPVVSVADDATVSILTMDGASSASLAITNRCDGKGYESTSSKPMRIGDGSGLVTTVYVKANGDGLTTGGDLVVNGGGISGLDVRSAKGAGVTTGGDLTQENGHVGISCSKDGGAPVACGGEWAYRKGFLQVFGAARLTDAPKGTYVRFGAPFGHDSGKGAVELKGGERYDVKASDDGKKYTLWPEYDATAAVFGLRQNTDSEAGEESLGLYSGDRRIATAEVVSTGRTQYDGTQSPEGDELKKSVGEPSMGRHEAPKEENGDAQAPVSDVGNGEIRDSPDNMSQTGDVSSRGAAAGGIVAALCASAAAVVAVARRHRS